VAGESVRRRLPVSTWSSTFDSAEDEPSADQLFDDLRAATTRLSSDGRAGSGGPLVPLWGLRQQHWGARRTWHRRRRRPASLACSVTTVAQNSAFQRDERSELLTSFSGAALNQSRERGRLWPERPKLTAASAPVLRQELKAFAQYMNEAGTDSDDYGQWFRNARMVVTGRAAIEMDRLIVTELRGEDGFQEALRNRTFLVAREVAAAGGAP